ncbi:MAG: hypothetical protein RLN72_15160 [Henriciella sp.]
MILQRLASSIRKQDWFTFLIETLIVVLGVFLGIQLGNWNEARQDRLREARYIERLDSEMDVIRDRLAGGVDVFTQSARGLDLLLDNIRLHRASPDADLPNDETLAYAVLNMTAGRVPAGSPAAFKEMVSSGALEILRNDELRQALFAYDEFAVIGRDAWRTIREQQHDATNTLFALVDMDAPEDYDAFILENDRSNIINFDRDRYLNDPEILTALNILQGSQINQSTLAREQLRLAEEIERLIAAEKTR